MVDLDPDISILYTAPKTLVSKSSVKICVSKKYNRKPVPDKTLKAQLDQKWNKRVKDNPTIWNGTKFRIARVQPTDQALTFHLGVTCYKDFLTTNWPPHAQELKRLGCARLNNERAYLSDAMGVGAMVVSRDEMVILLRRSRHVAEAAGWLDVPGGHSEPEMLVGKKTVEEILPDELDESEVVDEMFDSILREITDEVNIPVKSLSEPRIMGVAANNHSAGRPSIEFLLSCDLSSDEIVSLYQLGNQAEADESTNIVMLPLHDVLQLQNSSIWSKLAPSAKGCFHLYQMTR